MKKERVKFKEPDLEMAYQRVARRVKLKEKNILIIYSDQPNYLS